MKILLDLGNPSVREEVRLAQKKLREDIMKRWKNNAKQISSESGDKKNIFGFHFE